MLGNISIDFPIRKSSQMQGSFVGNGFGFSFHGYQFKDSSFGYMAGASIWMPVAALESNSGVFQFNLDGSFGLAFKLFDGDMFASFISAGVTVNMFDIMETIFDFDFGVFGDACLSFKLFDDFYITGGVQFNYYLYSYAIWPGVGSSSGNWGIYTITPRVGITMYE